MPRETASRPRKNSVKQNERRARTNETRRSPRGADVSRDRVRTPRARRPCCRARYTASAVGKHRCVSGSDPEGRRPKAGVKMWGVWAGAPAIEMDQRLAAVQVAVGNRRPAVGALVPARAVVHGDVTLHSHVRLFTRGALSAVGSRQGDQTQCGDRPAPRGANSVRSRPLCLYQIPCCVSSHPRPRGARAVRSGSAPRGASSVSSRPPCTCQIPCWASSHPDRVGSRGS